MLNTMIDNDTHAVGINQTHYGQFPVADHSLTDWTNVPHTDRKADVVLTSIGAEGDIIFVPRCRIRGAVIENSYFEIARNGRGFHRYRGRQRVEVVCLWYGRRPRTSFMNIIIDAPVTTITHRDVPVVHNIGRRR